MLHDVLRLLATADNQSHTILWQDAKRAVLAKAAKLEALPQPGDLGELLRLRFLAKEFRGY